MEERVASLEADASRIKSLLERMEPMISELFHTAARQPDVACLQNDVSKLDGRLAGVESRIGGLPTTWTMLSIVFTTWALGSGILIFAMNYLRR